MIDKTYDPLAIEARQYTRWEKSGAFQCGAVDSKPFTILMPPANVTGTLHVGHALTYTLQDILVRFNRMLGRDVLWQPGIDHAGIATQMVVERRLNSQGKDRYQLGRDDFLKEVWNWKEESGGTILSQLKRLGASADWQRERFTMDEASNEAVLKVFIDLYHKGLIYRDKRLVNWDVKLRTAVSDLEVEQREAKGCLWYIQYPLKDSQGAITVATTRPETLFGDTAIAVHPEDERYQSLIGQFAYLPLTKRVLPIIADESIDQEKGTGAVKITPAHDFNDFALGQRHNLEMLQILNEKAELSGDMVPEEFQGLTTQKARENVLEALEAAGLLEKMEEIVHTVPYGDRSGTVIEPLLTDQWFLDTQAIAERALKAVEEGKTKFVPEFWQNTYFEWLKNIQPWCLSRQIWWGHQIPAWYGPDGHIFVSASLEEALKEAEKYYGRKVELKQDEDVLDTWFSSALWPFVTLGWPEKTPELNRYYPTDVLVTGFDIIFFWVARMMMMGLHFMDEVPFKTVYIHPLIRDEKGQKMSKSKGNVMDPLDLINKYGADALRFTLTALTAQGRDIKLSDKRVEGHRNFITKIWNAMRYLQMNECELKKEFIPAECSLTVNRWIVHEVNSLIKEATEKLQDYKFNEYAQELYQFIWHTFCDWYLEFTKPLLNQGMASAQNETRATLAWVMKNILHLMHPVAPFITEELWQSFKREEDPLLIKASWPTFVPEALDSHALDEMKWLIKVISEIRATRAELNVSPGAWLKAYVRELSFENQERLKKHKELLLRLARLSEVENSEGSVSLSGAIQLVIDEATFILPIADVIDIQAEKERLEKAISKVGQEMEQVMKKLENPEFVAKAPLEVVDEFHERQAQGQLTKQKLQKALDLLARP